MDEDVIKSMINYGDEEDEAGDTRLIDTDAVRSEHENRQNKAAENDDAERTRVIDAAAVIRESRDYETRAASDTEEIEPDEDYFVGVEGEDENAPEISGGNGKGKPSESQAPEYFAPRREFDYDDYEDYDDYDDGPLLPMILGMLKIAVPVAALALIAMFIITSNNTAITKYRTNFSANTEKLLDNIGINIYESNKASEEEENVNKVEQKKVKNEASNEVVVDDSSGEPYKTETLSSVMVPFQGASEASFVKYGSGIVCAKTNYICYINDKGEKEWEKYVSITNPELHAEGKYILLNQKNGTKLLLYKNDEQLYEINSDDNILSCSVSANGDAALVTEKPSYKGAVVVYNKRGDKAFSWSAGSADIIAADISDNSRRVAAALLHTDGRVSSSVYLFDINRTDAYAKADFDDTLVFGTEFKGNSLTVFSDRFITGMDDKGKIGFNTGFDGAELISCGVDDGGNKIALYTQDNIPFINVYSANGSLRHTMKLKRMPDYAAIEKGNVIYNIDRDIILGKPDAKKPYKYTAAMDINGLMPIDDSSFMLIYSNGVEMVRMKGSIL